MDKAMSMMHHAGLSYGFWEHAVCAATHIYNRSPIRSLNWRTPHEIWSGGHTPDVSYFRVFGCKAYVHVHKDDWKKLDPKAIEAVLIGYEPGSKGYRLWDKHTRSVKLSRDVKFDKDQFPSCKSIETCLQDANASKESPNLISLILVPVDTSTTPPACAQTPPATSTMIPVTPRQEHSKPTSPPLRPQNTCVEVLPPSPDLRIPGGMGNEL